MTAEIAILNKLAVALAADSAVTISAGSEEEKIYDTADKLFDLCASSPLGVMIYNGMQFMQAPLPMLISDYRGHVPNVDHVPDAATDFLRYLSKWGAASPEAILEDSITNLVLPVMFSIQNRVDAKLQEFLRRGGGSPADDQDEWVKTFRAEFEDALGIFERVLPRRPRALFLSPDGDTAPPDLSEDDIKHIRGIVAEMFKGEEDAIIERLVDVGRHALLSDILSGGQTGIVFAGFGHKDTFPTLVSYEVDGMVGGRIRYVQTNFVDIDRRGHRAKVIPFAQKEMVDRFLYGLDDDIQRKVTQFCKATIPSISDQIIGQLDMEEGDQTALRKRATEAQDAFIQGLQNVSFAEIRSESKTEIEDMVEFMPKPELSTMAEALVNLTSLKRRVSRGMETVGGPIDVAVISRADGFIWVKRKHYFDSSLNPRYMSRINSNRKPWEKEHEAK